MSPLQVDGRFDQSKGSAEQYSSIFCVISIVHFILLPLQKVQIRRPL